jgi:DNA anti-recombination protein RmuC
MQAHTDNPNEETSAVTDVTKTLKDAAYITIGMGVIAFQKAQVARNDLSRQFEGESAKLQAQVADVLRVVEAQVEEARGTFQAQLLVTQSQLQRLAADLEERLAPVAQDVEARLDEIEVRLPEQVQALVKQARQATRDAGWQIRSLIMA